MPVPVAGGVLSVSVRVVDRDHGYAEMYRRVTGTRAAQLQVGVLEPEASESKAKADGGDDGDLTLVEVAMDNEFGGPNGNDPPGRSFVRAFFDEEREDLKGKLAQLMQGVIVGKRTREQALDLMGLYCVGRIQARIAAGIAPDNAQSTIDRKGSSTPLIASGQLRSGITYRVEDGEGGTG